eukprot:8946354-Pyramimonas_sp.AAC.2
MATTGVDMATTGVDTATTGVDMATTGVDMVTTGVDMATTGVDMVTTGVDRLRFLRATSVREFRTYRLTDACDGSLHPLERACEETRIVLRVL